MKKIYTTPSVMEKDISRRKSTMLCASVKTNFKIDASDVEQMEEYKDGTDGGTKEFEWDS